MDTWKTENKYVHILNCLYTDSIFQKRHLDLHFSISITACSWMHFIHNFLSLVFKSQSALWMHASSQPDNWAEFIYRIWVSPPLQFTFLRSLLTFQGLWLFPSWYPGSSGHKTRIFISFRCSVGPDFLSILRLKP